MKIYKPKFSLGSMSGPQTELQSKFGGRPWGFPEDKWPSADLVLLAQLVHEPPMIDLGGDFVLHLWHWVDPECFMDPPGYESNPMFSTLLRRDEIGTGQTAVPVSEHMVGEVFIDGWDILDDGVPADWEEDYYSESSYLDLLGRQTDEIITGRGLRTRFGGFPDWRGTEGICGLPDGVTFLFQTDGSFVSNEKLSYFSEAGTILVDESGARTGSRSKANAPSLVTEYKGDVVIRFTDFASDGIAFVFLDNRNEVPTVCWTWSR